MTKTADPVRGQANLEIARSNPASLYDEAYYSTGYSAGNDAAYGRQEPWLSFFGNISRKIKRRFRPKTAVDAGCGYGLLVEALNDQGIDSYGIDISTFAVSNAREDMRQRIKLGSVTDPIPLLDGKKYDIAICIEVLEHLPPEQAKVAIGNLCDASDRVVFSSTPDDFDEPTHFNVLPVDAWVQFFSENGLYLAQNPRAKFISDQAFVVERRKPRRGIFNF